MGSYTWKDSGEYTSGTTSQFIKSWDLWDIYNNYVFYNIPRYSTITKITFSVDAKQNLSLSKGSIGAYLSIYKDDVTGDDTVVALPDQDDAVTNSYKTFSNLVTSYFNLTGSSCGKPKGIQPYGLLNYLCIEAHSTVIRKHSIKNISLKFDYNDQYTISTSVSPSGSGTVSGGGTKTAGTTITLTAKPNSGYKFVKWSDGDTSNPRNVIVTGNASYSAVFEVDKIYVVYDSLFSFKRWKETNLVSNSLINVSDITDVGFKGTALVDDAYTNESRPIIPITKGKTYTFECATDSSKFEIFIFNCNSSGGWSDFTYGNTNKFNFTPNQDYISIRCDVVGTGTSVNFNDFRIYPSDCPYMSNTVLETERTDINSWSMPTPTRSGYKFLGWYTQPNGGGTKYTSSSSFPTSDLVLYSHWELQKYTINFKNVDGTTVSTKTLNSGATLGTLPTVTRSGYTFVGWIPCAPVKKIDNTILDSYYYDGAVAYPLLQSYKYTDNLSMHIEVYMADWMDIKNSTRQIMSCTESGGWGFGYQANSKVDGAEAHGFEVHTGSYTGYDLKFGTSGEYTNNKWYSFDITFSNGVIEIFVNGTSKGKRTTSSSTIKYNSSNTIFVGGEAKGDTSSAQNYFKGYISNVFIANQGTKLQIATTSTVVNSNIDYYPIWRKNTTFTATFKNHDGSVLQTVSVEHGGTPNYTGSTPTKSSTAEYSYSFSGWSPSIGVITSDTTYVAQFTATKRKYTISTSVTNGTISGEGIYEYGTSVILTVTPDNGYKFEKWSDGNTQNPRTITVTGNANYEAQIRRLILKFKSVKIYYPTGTNIVSPDNPLIANEKAQIVVQIALE